MPLTCRCYWEPGPGDHIWHDPEGYETLGPPIRRRQRCCSCNNLISLGETVARTQRSKVPNTDVERVIYGEDGHVPLADKFLCKTCADLFFYLQDRGYRVYAGENMLELAKEHTEKTGEEITNDQRRLQRLVQAAPANHAELAIRLGSARSLVEPSKD